MLATLCFAASLPLVLAFLLDCVQAVVTRVELVVALENSEDVLHVQFLIHRRNWRSYLLQFDEAVGRVGLCRMELPQPSELRWAKDMLNLASCSEPALGSSCAIFLLPLQSMVSR